MNTLTFDPTEGPSQAQMEAEAAALAQGQKIAEAQAADREAQWDSTARDNDDVSLIGGKFKSQEDLLKAYEELQKKMGSKTDEDEEEDDEAPVQEEAAADEEEGAAPNDAILSRAAQEYSEGGQLSDEAIEELSKMDSKDLIKAYVDFYSRSAQQYQQAQVGDAELSKIKDIAGGEESYGEMISWAAENLDPAEIESFNSVTDSGNVQAIRFAVEALNNRYKAANGDERPMISGKASRSTPQGYRSQAELARDIANPLYQSDPAFRADVEAKLKRSKDLMF